MYVYVYVYVIVEFLLLLLFVPVIVSLLRVGITDDAILASFRVTLLIFEEGTPDFGLILMLSFQRIRSIR